MDALQNAMIEIIVFVQSVSNPFLDSFFQLITMIGEDTFFIIMVALVYWCINKDFGYKMGFAYLTSGVLNTVIKEIHESSAPDWPSGSDLCEWKQREAIPFPAGIHNRQQFLVFLDAEVSQKVAVHSWINFDCAGRVIPNLSGCPHTSGCSRRHYSWLYLGLCI